MTRSRILVVVCTAAIAFLLAAISRAPYTPPGADEAILRFSWRLSVPAQENCRTRTQAELDALPAHMRSPEVCTRDDADYTLITQLDEARPDTVELARGGLKGDRPLFVLEERTLPPGVARVRVDLRRESSASGTSTLASLDTVVSLEPGWVQLVTLDAEGRRLVARASAARPSAER